MQWKIADDIIFDGLKSYNISNHRKTYLFGRRSSTDLVSMTFGRIVKIYYTIVIFIVGKHLRLQQPSICLLFACTTCRIVSWARPVGNRFFIWQSGVWVRNDARWREVFETNRILRLTNISLCAHTQCRYLYTVFIASNSTAPFSAATRIDFKVTKSAKFSQWSLTIPRYLCVTW